MKPGSELDALVAEKVMGWKPNYPGGWPHPPKDVPNRKRFLNKDGETVIPNYSTDIAAVWEVVNKMRENGFESYLIGGPSAEVKSGRMPSFGCRFFDGNQKMAFVRSEADSAPHAICLAALKVVGVFTDKI